MAIATATELASYLQQDLDTASAQLALDLVESEITVALGGTLPDPLPGVAKRIELAAAGRLYLNPSGAESETTGPFSRRFGTEGLLTDEERSALSRVRGTSHTLSLAGPDPVTDTSILF